MESVLCLECKTSWHYIYIYIYIAIAQRICMKNYYDLQKDDLVELYIINI